MSFWQFADIHPWFALGIVIAAAIALEGVADAIRQGLADRRKGFDDDCH